MQDYSTKSVQKLLVREGFIMANGESRSNPRLETFSAMLCNSTLEIAEKL